MNQSRLLLRGAYGCLLSLSSGVLAIVVTWLTKSYQYPSHPVCPEGRIGGGFPFLFICDDRGGGSPTSSWGIIDYADVLNGGLHSQGYLLDVLVYFMLFFAVGLLWAAIQSKAARDDSPMTTKRGAFAFIVGGVLWAVVMVAYLKTHGPGTSDYKRLLFGLSRDNYMLLLSPAALLLGYGLASLRRYFLPLTGRLFAVTSMGALMLLGMFAFGNLVMTTQVGVGEHLPWPNNSPVNLIGSVLQSLSLPQLGICLALMGTALWRARRFRAGAGVLLAPLALIALLPWQAIHSYPGVTFGVAWAILGVLYAATEAVQAGSVARRGML